MTLQRNQIDLDRNICEISETNDPDSDDDTFIADKTFIISNPFFSRHKMIINDKDPNASNSTNTFTTFPNRTVFVGNHFIF